MIHTVHFTASNNPYHSTVKTLAALCIRIIRACDGAIQGHQTPKSDVVPSVMKLAKLSEAFLSRILRVETPHLGLFSSRT